jgi:hypothetical protein
MDNNEDNTPEWTDQPEDNGQPLPKLYSENAIMGFAFFCSTLFASFLTIENMRTAKAKKGIVPVILFTIGFTAIEGLIIKTLPVKYSMFIILFNLVGGVILNLFFWKKYIPANLPYEPKPITKPLLIAAMLILIMLAFTNQAPK